jgi:hypothetical protein
MQSTHTASASLEKASVSTLQRSHMPQPVAQHVKPRCSRRVADLSLQPSPEAASRGPLRQKVRRGRLVPAVQATWGTRDGFSTACLRGGPSCLSCRTALLWESKSLQGRMGGLGRSFHQRDRPPFVSQYRGHRWATGLAGHGQSRRRLAAEHRRHGQTADGRTPVWTSGTGSSNCRPFLLVEN